MTRRLILADDTFVNHAVDDRNGVFVGSRSRFFVASFAGIKNVFDLRTHHRA